ncbi:MAG: hypothetical protein AAF414_14260 [Pseudomonadota bacterium]
MTLGRFFRISAAAIIGSAILTTSASALFSPRIEDFEEAVIEELAEYGISQADVVGLRVYPHYDRRDQIDRATGWVHIEQCPEGQIVVELSAFATVTYAYTRGQCEVPGLS